MGKYGELFKGILPMMIEDVAEERTSEDAFEATLECISSLHLTPLQLLKALKWGMLKTALGHPHISDDLKTIEDSTSYVKSVLSKPAELPESAERISYERIDERW